MSHVGIVSIVVGVFAVIARGQLLVAPAFTVRTFKRAIETDGGIRAFGAVLLVLGAAMAWAGASEHSLLARVLFWFGWLTLAGTTPVLMLFPKFYRSLAALFLPPDDAASFTGLRVVGLLGVAVGGVLIYFGALAL